MKPRLMLLATLAAALAAPSGLAARTLLPDDPYDARIIAAHLCNRAAVKVDFDTNQLDQCRAVYDETVRVERSAVRMTPAQKNALVIAKGLSMMTLSSGYAKRDGVMSARACQAIAGIDQALARYDPASPNGLESLYKLLVQTRDTAIPKCRIGGHWSG